VGRSHETEVLTEALTDALAGTGALVFVVGEAGIGKSRLVTEVATDGVPAARGGVAAGAGRTTRRRR
jgi:hypothetical protein